MKYKPELINEAIVTLSRTLDDDSSSGDLTDSLRPVTLEELKAFLVPRISTLLDRNPGYLMSILYRIDVDEAKVKNVMNNSSLENIASQLADLMIDRELQKVKTRHESRHSL